jgi:hypothetical protein
MKIDVKASGGVFDNKAAAANEESLKEAAADEASGQIIERSPVQQVVVGVQNAIIQSLGALGQVILTIGTAAASLSVTAVLGTVATTIVVTVFVAPVVAPVIVDLIPPPEVVVPEVPDKPEQPPEEQPAPPEVPPEAPPAPTDQVILDPNYQKNIMKNVITSIANDPSLASQAASAQPYRPPTSSFSVVPPDGSLGTDLSNFILQNLCF